MVDWPSGLPQCPNLNAFTEQKQRNVVAFQPEVGPPKLRRRSTASSWLTSVTFRMTNDQVEIFNDFYSDDLFDGMLPFIWAHPITKLDYFWVFAADEAPKIQRMTPNTQSVSFNLLRLP